jgi:hypothetical protein
VMKALEPLWMVDLIYPTDQLELRSVTELVKVDYAHGLAPWK